MASGFTFDVKGLAALEQRMKNLADDAATKLGQASIRAGTVYLAKKVADAAPIGPDAEGSKRKRHRKGGKVVEEEHLKIKNHVEVKKTRSTNANTVESSLSITPYHAAFVEFGSIHNTPNPFAKNTFEAEKQAATDIVAKIIEKRLTKAGV